MIYKEKKHNEQHKSDKVKVSEVILQCCGIRNDTQSEVVGMRPGGGRRGWRELKRFEKTDRKRFMSACTDGTEISYDVVDRGPTKRLSWWGCLLNASPCIWGWLRASC